MPGFLRRVGLFFCAVFILQGCFLVPAIDSFKKLGVTREDRVKLLAPEIKRFEECLGWDDNFSALAYVDKEKRSAVSQQFRDRLKSERVVDHKIVSIDFSEDGYSATAEVIVRAYKVPYYVVQEHTEIHKWRFNLSDGWKLTELERRSETGSPAV